MYTIQCTKWDIWDLFYIEACMKRAKKCNSEKLYGMKIVEKPERMNWMICLMKLQIGVFFLVKSADCRPLYDTLYVWREKKKSQKWTYFLLLLTFFFALSSIKYFVCRDSFQCCLAKQCRRYCILNFWFCSLHLLLLCFICSFIDCFIFISVAL